MVIFVIIFFIIIFIGLIFLIKHIIFCKFVVSQFENCNVIVAGKKGTGKDLLFQYIINKRKDYYYSNICYGKEYGFNRLKSLKTVSCNPNDYKHIVEDKIEKQPHAFKENKDIYISDIGVFLPSYMDSKLYVQFPSMPILYALSRHLYNSNIHCNTQNIERGWKALREQADFYIQCKGTFRFLGFLITKIYTYDKYDSARSCYEPIKPRLFNKYSKAEIDIYNAEKGDIRKGHIIQRIKNIKYDTRAFEKILLKGKRKY